MRRVEEIQAVAGLGLQGDRYSERTGVYSGVDECQVTLIEGEGTDEISRRMGLAINSRGLGSEFIRRFLTEMDLVISRDSRQIVDWLRHRTTRSPACLAADTARIHSHLQPRIKIPGILVVRLLLHLALLFEQRVHCVVGHRFAELGVDRFKLFQQIDDLLYGFFDNLAHRSRIVY